MVKSYKIAVLKGDGIGPEVTNATVKVLDAIQVELVLSLITFMAKQVSTALLNMALTCLRKL